MIDIFDSSAFERPTHGNVIKNRKMLDVFAKPNTSGVRTNRYAEFRGHKKHGNYFVHSGKTTAVDLTKVDRASLQQLLEHHPVVTMFSGRDSYRCHSLTDDSVAENVIRTGRFL